MNQKQSIGLVLKANFCKNYDQFLFNEKLIIFIYFFVGGEDFMGKLI